MEWIKCSDRMPHRGTGRYLIMIKCHHFAHNLLWHNYPYPCNEINIAYYDYVNKWHYETNLRWDDKIEVTHWAELSTDLLPKSTELVDEPYFERDYP